MEALSERQRYWLKHIKASETQGLSLRAYALANGLGVSTIYAWRQRLEAVNVIDDVEPSGHDVENTPTPATTQSSPSPFVTAYFETPRNETLDCRIELPNGKENKGHPSL